MINQQKSTFLYLAGIILVTLAAWGRYFSTGSFRVDDNPVMTWALYPILLLFLGGLILNFMGYVRFIQAPTLSLKKIKSVAIVAVLIAMLMPPMLSNDVMIYMAFGDLLNQGIVSYVDATLLGESKFVDYVAADWLDCPNLYSPFLLMMFGASTWLGKSMVGSLVVFKIIVGIFAYLFVELTYLFFKHQNITTKKYNTFALLVLAPVIWLQAIGQMHVDGIIMTIIMAMLYCLVQKKWLLAAVLTALVILSKTMYVVVFIPFFTVYMFYQMNFKWLNFLKKISASLAIIAILCVGVYAPFWESSKTLTTPIEYHENKPPSRSHVEVLTDVVFYGSKLFGQPDDFEVGNLATNDGQEKDNKKAISKPLTTFFKLFGVLIAAWVFLGLGFIKNHQTIFHIFAKILLVVVCFFSPIFHPWYFLLVLPFFVFTQEKSWVIFIAAVFSFSNLHEIAFSIPKSSPLYLVSLLFVLFMVIFFFIYFKKHFIQETWTLVKNNAFIAKKI